MNFFGSRTDRWGTIPLPFQWPGTNCFIYTDLVVSFSQIVQPTARRPC